MEKNNGILTPLRCLSKNAESTFVFVVLNQGGDTAERLSAISEATFRNLWNKAIYTACVDGGTNFVHSLNQVTTHQYKCIPDLISGDFDSIMPGLCDIYKELGSEIVTTFDQDHTDFTKCMLLLKQKYESGIIPSISNIIVAIPEFSNRFDHLMANINTLYKGFSLLPETKNFGLLSSKTYAFIIPTGKTSIKLNNNMDDKITLLAVRHPATVTTTGLRKNLNNTEVTFGSAIWMCTLDPEANKQLTIVSTQSLLAFLYLVML